MRIISTDNFTYMTRDEKEIEKYVQWITTNYEGYNKKHHLAFTKARSVDRKELISLREEVAVSV